MVLTLAIVFGFGVLFLLFTISSRLLEIDKKTREVTDRLDKIVEALDYIFDSMPDEPRNRKVNERINAMAEHYKVLAAIPLKTRLAIGSDSPLQSDQEPTYKIESEKGK